MAQMGISEENLKTIVREHPGANITIIFGGVTMTDNKRIMSGDFSNASGVFNQGDNSNINQGAGNTIEISKVDELINALKKDITEKLNGAEKDDALADAEQLASAMKSENWPRARKLLGLFSDVIRTCGSAASIASFIGA